MEVLMIIRKTAPDVLFAASGTLQSSVGASATGIKMKRFFIQGSFSVVPATASLPFRTDAAGRAIRELANMPWRQSPWCLLLILQSAPPGRALWIFLRIIIEFIIPFSGPQNPVIMKNAFLREIPSSEMLYTE